MKNLTCRTKMIQLMRPRRMTISSAEVIVTCGKPPYVSVYAVCYMLYVLHVT
jgi:hypothetical protein